ncbi:MAG: sel1 repeat family protein [Gammaproteobacteria bacterium]|nr:sel1 repeat family protein [Gammaproteobacteria bacterium]
MRRIFCTIVLLTLPFMSYAYKGDYVWEEKYKERLPLAESGNAEAQYDVGEMLERGRGVNKDLTQAFNWYLKSAEQGNTKGAFRAGLAYLKGKGVEKNDEFALKWLQLSADRGYERAVYYLGVMYEKGEGVEVNYTRALSNYKKALTAGYAPAKERINEVKKAIEEERIRTERAEAAERRRRELALKRQLEEAKARKVSVSRSMTTKQLLLQGGWSKRNKPAEYLPSDISDCSDEGRRIECMSKEVNRDIGTANIKYQTKAIIYSIDNKGTFKISYRNKVTKVIAKDPALSDKVPVKEGWQDAEHVLECELEENKLVNCTKDKIRKVRFTRK